MFHGGLFTSYILLALESMEYKTCCLNWHVNEQTNKQALNLLNLNNDQIINCFVIIGKESIRKKYTSYKEKTTNLIKKIM